MAQRLTDNNDTTPALADLVADLGELFARIAPISSTYTPIATPVANVATTVMNANVGYVRLGNFVFAAGSFELDPTAANVATTLQISLPPVASNLSSYNQLSGAAQRNSSSLTPLSAAIIGDAVTDRAQISFLNDSSTGSWIWSFWFVYLVV